MTTAQNFDESRTSENLGFSPFAVSFFFTFLSECSMGTSRDARA